MTYAAKTKATVAEIKSAIAELIAYFDAPFGLNAANAKAKLQGYRLACEDQTIELVDKAVKDFGAGRVSRPAAKRGKLPTSDEFGAHLRELSKAGAIVVANPANADGSQQATKFGKVWTIARLGTMLRCQPKPVAAELLEPKRSHSRWPYLAALDGPTTRSIDPKRAISQASLDACIWVPIGSEAWTAWHSFHSELDWLFIIPNEDTKGVWFPCEYPSQWRNYAEARSQKMELAS